MINRKSKLQESIKSEYESYMYIIEYIFYNRSKVLKEFENYNKPDETLESLEKYLKDKKKNLQEKLFSVICKEFDVLFFSHILKNRNVRRK